MNANEIQELILIADGFMLELMEGVYDEQQHGCMDCGDTSTVSQLIMLKEQLNYKISIEDYGKETQSLYSCLLGAVANYSGASITLDPNASIPNTVIIVPIPYVPEWFDALFSEFDADSEDVNGGRYVYTNPILDGWNPDTKLVNALTGQELTLGVHYDMYEGGVLVLRADYPVYEGQRLRFDNFQQNTPLATQLLHVTFYPAPQPIVWDDTDVWDDSQIWTD